MAEELRKRTSYRGIVLTGLGTHRGSDPEYFVGCKVVYMHDSAPGGWRAL